MPKVWRPVWKFARSNQASRHCAPQFAANQGQVSAALSHKTNRAYFFCLSVMFCIVYSLAHPFNDSNQKPSILLKLDRPENSQGEQHCSSSCDWQNERSGWLPDCPSSVDIALVNQEESFLIAEVLLIKTQPIFLQRRRSSSPLVSGARPRSWRPGCDTSGLRRTQTRHRRPLQTQWRNVSHGTTLFYQALSLLAIESTANLCLTCF